MFFYHVLGHTDLFQNNLFFRHTWEYDFSGQALADKRLIAKLRSEKGRWVDYIIEFARSIDNLVGYFGHLAAVGQNGRKLSPLDYDFDIFRQDREKKSIAAYVAEIERYNKLVKEFPEDGGERFIDSVRKKYAEFDTLHEKAVKEQGKGGRRDLLQFLMENSPFLAKEENKWMLTVIEVIRATSLYFQPQIRTKILNEGWASYWHDHLFLRDDRIRGHEVEYAVVNAKVTSMPRVGLNPYALGMRLFEFLEEQADKGKMSFDYRRISDQHQRHHYDAASNRGKDFIFSIRKNFCDAMFINSFIDQEFVDRYRLFVVDRRLNKERMVWQYYVKSRKASDYKAMLAESLYHPPAVAIAVDDDNTLVLNHLFESKPLYRDYIDGALMGVEFLWGGKTCLYTHEPEPVKKDQGQSGKEEHPPREIKWRRIRYTMKDRKMTRVQV